MREKRKAASTSDKRIDKDTLSSISIRGGMTSDAIRRRNSTRVSKELILCFRFVPSACCANGLKRREKEKN